MDPPSDPAAEAVFRPVPSGNALEATVDRLLCAIRLGVVPAGTRFPAERDLATRLNISRVTLREALRHLQDRGYAESRRGRSGGTFVSDVPPVPTPDQALRGLTATGSRLDDLLTHRRGLETGVVVRLAETGLTAAQDRLLAARLADADRAGQDAYRRFDTVLHVTLARLTGSGELANALTDVRLRVNGLMDTAPPSEEGMALSNAQHHAIVGAVRSRDPEAARLALGAHLAAVEAELRARFG
ncbi:FCD domain-containing protein [Nocardiopsis sp. CT-R113]|uniref:FCD domain-containing protein n=1 Tax=Nocardiopsis codii TaxID=3065942 RepID=A0ABU7KBR9_9ACTN|nr:FCD domain-containing protein [Nocardiopsis sp. CT-R113]MEE2039676.1 FCD domain-containing protein [Nocardiopsis sp. CT-R113]